MRNMSFSLTTDAAREKSKTVTRRFGWWFLKPGDEIQQVEKAMGLKKGETAKKIHKIRVVSVKRERLGDILNYSQDECVREGFPDFTQQKFLDYICYGMNKSPDDWVNRIEFEYLANDNSQNQE